MKVRASYCLSMLLTVASINGCGREEATQDNSAFTPLKSDNASVQMRYHGDPDPPREGDNKIQVSVAHVDGSDVSDADVSVTYYMPAMASMNMPEMRDTFSLSHVGSGTYAGTVRLSMGGTWQVTVSVTQRGEALSRARFTIIASE